MPSPYPPASAEDLARLHELAVAEHGLRQELYDLELARIPLLAAGQRVRHEQDVVYRRLAVERGLPAHTLLDVNMKTGEVRVVNVPSEAPASEVQSPEGATEVEEPPNPT